MSFHRHLSRIVSLLFVPGGSHPALGREARLPGFDDYENKALREWEVPGLEWSKNT